MASVQKGWHIRIGKFKITFTLKKVLLNLFIIALAGFMALPLIYVISTAFKPLDELFIFPPRFFVRNPTLNNFNDLVITLSGTTVPFLRYVFNSLYTTALTVFLSIIVSCMGAYALVKFKLPGAKVISFIIISSLMFSGHVTQIPSYLIVNYLGLVDTPGALIIPKISVAFNLFLIQQFVVQLPDPLLEAAKIDGASQWKIFWKIVMPFLSPAWATLLVFSFVANWNDFFTPLIYISSEAQKTLPLAMQSISNGANIGRAGAAAATTFIMIVPTVLIFTLAQKKVIETMAHSGIKG